MADGFLGRWSRRKLDAKAGKPLEEPPPPVAAPEPAPPAAAAAVAVPAAEPAPAPAEPLPTLEDVKGLTPESDFSRFVRPGVDPGVKNAAVKKLFADPRFNIQDGLDVYIDDYSKPDPLPESMLRQLAGAHFLGLFREEERKDEQEGGAREHAEAEGNASVAQSPSALPADEPAGATPPAVPPDHADPDLRLQQDDPAGPGGTGRGAG